MLYHRILLTGHDGYIGSHLMPYLEDLGYEVDPYLGDIADFSVNLFDDYDMVIHLAALAGVRRSVEIPDEYYKVNVDGTRRVIEECSFSRTPLLFASSSNAKEWWTNPYAVTKKITEELAKHTNAIAFRPHTVYPGRPDMLFDQLQKDPNSIKYINVDHTRDFTHIEDFCSALLTLIENYSIIVGKVVDIGSGVPVRVIDVAKAFGWEGEEITTPTPQERVHTKADSTLLASLGWKPEKDIFDEIRNTK